MDGYEQLVATRMQGITIKGTGGVADQPVGQNFVTAHEAYHATLHTPKAYPNSARWLQLAFLNYSAFMGMGMASMMIDSMTDLEAQRVRTADDLRLHLEYAWTAEGVLSRIGSALDAIGGGIYGLLSNKDPLSVTYYFELIDNTNNWKRGNDITASSEAVHFVPLLRAAIDDLAEFRLYRNKTVHTVSSARYYDGTEQRLVDLARIYGTGTFDSAAFQRIYGTNLPVYGGTVDPSDYHALPLRSQLERYLAVALRHGAALETQMAQTYTAIVLPTL